MRTLMIPLLIVFLLSGCSRQEEHNAQLDANKQLVLAFWDAFYNQKDMERAFQHFSEDAIYESFGTGTADTGRVKIRETEEVFPTAFPDGKFKSEGIYAEGEYVILRWNADGTNTVSLMGMPPTSKYVSVHGVQIFLISNGKIQHVWDYWNMADFLKQMGIGG